MTPSEPIYNPDFFIITGGPGVGKTTLLHALEKHKFRCIAEVAREIIKQQMEIDGEALPWKNNKLYAQLMFDRSIESYEKAYRGMKEIVFFDRGIPDTLGYVKLINASITEEMDWYANHFRYSKKVFILPPWFDIYKTDNERKQNWEEAVQTYETIVDIYRQYDYELIEVPKATIDQRVGFICEQLNLKYNNSQ